jgi:hypothetical protein
MALNDYPIAYGPSGGPDVPYDRFAAILTAAGSPAAAFAHGMYSHLAANRVNPAFFLAVFGHESRYGTVGICKDYDTKNPGNVRSPEIASAAVVIDTPRGRFAKYPDWLTATFDWCQRLRGPKYEGAGLTTVRAVLPKYAPSGDQGNSPEAYIAAVLASIEQRIDTGGPPVALQKPPVDTSHPSPNRNGYGGTRRVDAVVWHVTAGGFPGSLGWLTNPASSASANYLLDKDGSLYELVPPDQDAWGNGAVSKPDTSNPLIPKW